MAGSRNIKDILFYAFAVLLVSGSNFASVPLLVQAFGEVGYAEWATIEPLILLAIPLGGLGIQYGLLNVMRGDGNSYAKLLPWHLTSSILAAFIIAAFFGVAGKSIETSILAAGIVGIESALSFYVAFWRGSNKPEMYAATEGVRTFTIALVVIIILAIHLSDFSIDGYLGIRLIIDVAFILLSLRLLGVKWQSDLSAAGSAIKYGLPIVIASAIVSGFMNFDRYAIFPFSTPPEITSYVTHTKIVQILASALSPFFIWFAPVAIAAIAEGTSSKLFPRMFLAFLGVNIALSSGLWIVAPHLWPVLFPEMALDRTLFGINLLGIAVFACGNPLSAGSLKKGNTMASLIIAALSAFVGFSIILLLTPIFGLYGTAIGKASAMIAYTAGFAIHTQITLRFRYDWSIAILIVVLGVGVTYLCENIVTDVHFFGSIMLGSISASVIFVTSLALCKLRSGPN